MNMNGEWIRIWRRSRLVRRHAYYPGICLGLVRRRAYYPGICLRLVWRHVYYPDICLGSVRKYIKDEVTIAGRDSNQIPALCLTSVSSMAYLTRESRVTDLNGYLYRKFTACVHIGTQPLDHVFLGWNDATCHALLGLGFLVCRYCLQTKVTNN
jgi:hypothetical protein